MKTIQAALLVLLLFCIAPSASAQSGPWARYDQQLKDDALYREASDGNLQEVKSIVAGGGNIHVVMKQTKGTILMAAAGSGKIELVRYLLSLGADPQAKDWGNQTALDKARAAGAKDVEQLLASAMKGGGPQAETKKPLPALPAVKPAAKADPQATTPARPGSWPLFGTFQVGDPVLYWVATGWRKGVVKEVGVKTPSGKLSVDYSEKKYYVSPEVQALGDEWKEWTGVVSPQRQAFWTAWFVGSWQLGEVGAQHTEVKNGTETDTYYYLDATESLQVKADGTYRWQLMDKKVKTGKWIPAGDGPGIVLLKAYRDFDWTLRNRTTVEDWRIRKLDQIELKPSAIVLSIRGKRKTTL